MLGLGGATEDEKVIHLINAVEELKKKVDIHSTLKEVIQVRESSGRNHVRDRRADCSRMLIHCQASSATGGGTVAGICS